MTGRIRTLTAATAIAAVATAAGAVSAGASSLTEFRSPTGNIGCYIMSSGVRCDIGHYSYTPPAHHCGGPFGGGYGNAFFVGAKGDGTLICVTDSALDPTGHALAYGRSITRGSYTCSSASTGMTCRNTRDGHGFFLSIQSYKVF
jgi:hypothetical protein